MLLYLCRNAEVSNDFKVDLHALHVDEALSSLEDAIVDLQRFKCKLPIMCFNIIVCSPEWMCWAVANLAATQLNSGQLLCC